MGTEYIHYGNTKFEPDRFKEIKNQKYWTKPYGGFWASPVDAQYGWKEWNEDEDFRECNIENSFTFTLKDSANVIHIHSARDLELLPKIGDVTYQFLEPFESEKKLRKEYEKHRKNIMEDKYNRYRVVDEEKPMRRLYWSNHGFYADAEYVKFNG